MNSICAYYCLKGEKKGRNVSNLHLPILKGFSSIFKDLNLREHVFTSQWIVLFKILVCGCTHLNIAQIWILFLFIDPYNETIFSDEYNYQICVLHGSRFDLFSWENRINFWEDLSAAILTINLSFNCCFDETKRMKNHSGFLSKEKLLRICCHLPR